MAKSMPKDGQQRVTELLGQAERQLSEQAERTRAWEEAGRREDAAIRRDAGDRTADPSRAAEIDKRAAERRGKAGA